MLSIKYFACSLFLFTLFSCSESVQKDAAPVEVPSEKGVSYSDSTSKSFEQILQTYYAVKDALVAADSVKAAAQSLVLANDLDQINLASVQQKDAALYTSVSDLPAIIKKASVELANKSGLEAQREIFETISDNLYELIKTLKPSGIETYQQYCPMAFNDKGAHWLSDTTHIQNPYFGKKMLICGEVKEELRYQ